MEKIRQVMGQSLGHRWRVVLLAKEVSEGFSEEWRLARDLIVEKEPAMLVRLIIPRVG